MNLRNKFLIVIMISSIPMIIIAGTLNYHASQFHIIEDTLDHLNAIATIQKERVNDSIDRNLERLQSVTSRTQLRLSLDAYNQNPNEIDGDKIRHILNDAVASIVDYEEIIIYDLNGNEKFSTMNYASHNFIPDDIISSDQDNFLNFVHDGINPKLVMSAPLILDEKILATLVIVAIPDSILDITSDHTGLGLTGESFLAQRNADGDALFLTPLRFDSNAQLNKVISSEQSNVPIIRALSKQESNFIDTVDYRGVEVLSSSKYIEKTDWGLVVKIDKSEIFQNLTYVQLISAGNVFVVAIISLILSILFSRNISSPIIALRKATKDIAKGNLETKITLNGPDEIIGLASDIQTMKTELEKAENRIIKNAKMYAVSEFSSRLINELKNPLDVISTLVYLIKKRNQNILSDKDKEDFERVSIASDKLKDHIDNLLVLVGKTMKKEKILLSKIITKSLKSVIIPDKVIVNKPTEDYELVCDPHKIEIVFVNLIKNAIQAVNGEGTITIKMTKEKSYLNIDFINSGPDMPDDVLSKLFEPLLTTKQEGLGLSLVSCKTIVEQHGGKITVKNDPTTFSVILPLDDNLS
ncbi:putative Histidine kinase [Nitrosopumilus piranensis]|uniref:histidine kinase n=1 Tax=Nitrosopumilus piranensis TaxID=1582439 RepID=A0A0C5C0P9_9ARCH|nr:putative Histidine kinase [Nitrosopumilus piranensis]